MIDWAETARSLKPFVPLFTLVCGGASGGIWAYLAVRQKTTVSAPADLTTSQAGMAAMLNGQTQIILNESAKDRKDLKRRVDRQGKQLTMLANKVSDCETRHNECETTVAALKAHIDKHIVKDSAI